MGSRFIDTRSDQYIVSGYCYLLDLEGGGTPCKSQAANQLQAPKNGSEPIVRKIRAKRNWSLILHWDNLKRAPNLNTTSAWSLPVVCTVESKFTTVTSHLKSDYEPTGGNIGFLDSHVEWRTFENMRMRFGTNPGFWW